MAEKRSSHLRVVRTPSAPARAPEVSRADTYPTNTYPTDTDPTDTYPTDTYPTETYFAELRALRDERRRLRAG